MFRYAPGLLALFFCATACADSCRFWYDRVLSRTYELLVSRWWPPQHGATTKLPPPPAKEFPVHAAEVAHPEPWRVKRVVDDYDPFYNLETLAKRFPFSVLLEKIGIRILPDAAGVEIPPPAELNQKLKAMGLPFQVAAVDGVIRFEPWLDLMAQGKYPVGDGHDLQTHWMAMLLMPPKVGLAYQGQIGFLRSVQTELAAPGPMTKYIEDRLGDIGRGFEGGTYTLAYTLTETHAIEMRKLSRYDYPSVTGCYLRSCGAPAELKIMAKVVSEKWRDLGFASPKAAKEFNGRLQTQLAKLSAEDPARFGAEVANSEFDGLLRAHFAKLGLIDGQPD
jgi:hypothetical protein